MLFLFNFVHMYDYFNDMIFGPVNFRDPVCPFGPGFTDDFHTSFQRLEDSLKHGFLLFCIFVHPAPASAAPTPTTAAASSTTNVRRFISPAHVLVLLMFLAFHALKGPLLCDPG